MKINVNDILKNLINDDSIQKNYLYNVHMRKKIK